MARVRGKTPYPSSHSIKITSHCLLCRPVVHKRQLSLCCCAQAHEEAGQAKARLGVCERELTLARQEAEGSTRSGQALAAELHTLGRQNAAVQQQVISLQAQLEETIDSRQAEVWLLAPPCALFQYGILAMVTP